MGSRVQCGQEWSRAREPAVRESPMSRETVVKVCGDGSFCADSCAGGRTSLCLYPGVAGNGAEVYSSGGSSGSYADRRRSGVWSNSGSHLEQYLAQVDSGNVTEGPH